MKIRMHRGGFTESMATCEEIEPTIQAVTDYINRHGWSYSWLTLAKGSIITPNMVEVENYLAHADTRNGWARTYMVLVMRVPYGWTDQPINTVEDA